MADYYDELFKLCGYEEDELNEERPRIEKTLGKLGLGPEDMKTAESWVRQHHDVELTGARKVLGCWLDNLIDLVLARDEGKKVIYYGFPSIPGPGAAIAAASDDVFCSCPDMIICHAVGQIFNKLTPILEAGEENGLPPGHSMCALQQVRVGALAKGIIPIPDMVFMSSYYCDMGSKTDDLLHEKYGHQAVIVDGSMDSRWSEYPDYDPQRVEYLGTQLNKIFEQVKEITGVEVTQEATEKSRSLRRRFFDAQNELTQLMTADPMPLSQVESSLAKRVGELVGSRTSRAMTKAPEAVELLNREVKERVDKGVGVVEKGAPRVAMFLTHTSDPRITHMMEDCGLAPSIELASVPPPRETSQRGTYPSLGHGIATREMRYGGYHSTYGLIRVFGHAIQTLKPDGIIWAYLFSCRPLAQTSHTFKKWVEENTGVPTLSLEFDLYDSRYYSAASLRSRVEAFAEMLRFRKASAKV